MAATFEKIEMGGGGGASVGNNPSCAPRVHTNSSGCWKSVVPFCVSRSGRPVFKCPPSPEKKMMSSVLLFFLWDILETVGTLRCTKSTLFIPGLSRSNWFRVRLFFSLLHLF